MLTRPQQILLKRAQREAGLDDADYRDALELVSGCRSSKSPQMTDRHLDLALAYLEAIHWRKVDAGALPPHCNPNAVFRQRGYWAAKNRAGNTSRDRYSGRNLEQEIIGLEAQLQAIGFSQSYCATIRQNTTHGRTDEHATHLYRAALERTLRAKRRTGATA